jgi:hypothetical protein
MIRFIDFFGAKRKVLAEYDEGMMTHILFADAKFSFVWLGGRRGEITSIEGNPAELTKMQGGRAIGCAQVNYKYGTCLFASYEYRLGLNRRDSMMAQNGLLIDATELKTAEIPDSVESKVEKPDIDELLVFRFSRAIMDEMDTKTKAPPAPSLVFTLLCRDKMEIADIHRKHRWSVRTLKYRKAQIKAFLWEKHKLSIGDFKGVDRAIFKYADNMLSDHRAKRIRETALAECEIENEDED